MDIRVSFSYLTQNKEHGLWYCWANQSQPTFSLRKTNTQQMKDFEKEIHAMELTDILEKTFEINTEPFNSSGVMPYKLVCAYAYITK